MGGESVLARGDAIELKAPARVGRRLTVIAGERDYRVAEGLLADAVVRDAAHRHRSAASLRPNRMRQHESATDGGVRDTTKP